MGTTIITIEKAEGVMVNECQISFELPRQMSPACVINGGKGIPE
jgi:hypothetical protein